MLTLKQIDGEWWIEDDGEMYGPYYTKKEAEADRRGLTNFYKYEGTDGYVTVTR